MYCMVVTTIPPLVQNVLWLSSPTTLYILFMLPSVFDRGHCYSTGDGYNQPCVFEVQQMSEIAPVRFRAHGGTKTSFFDSKLIQAGAIIIYVTLSLDNVSSIRFFCLEFTDLLELTKIRVRTLAVISHGTQSSLLFCLIS